MREELLLQYVNEIKEIYDDRLVYIDFYTEIGPILNIKFISCDYELELNSLHYTDCDGDPIIEKCKQIFIKYKRHETLKKLL